jgi:uncharacterized membrane protein
MIGSHLGWLDIYPSMLWIIAFFIVICLTAFRRQEEPQYLEALNKIWIALICIAVFAMILVTMFLAWTPNTGKVIYGVQGRYFLPILPLILLLLRNSILTLKSNIEKPVILTIYLLQTMTIINVFELIIER